MRLKHSTMVGNILNKMIVILFAAAASFPKNQGAHVEYICKMEVQWGMTQDVRVLPLPNKSQ